MASHPLRMRKALGSNPSVSNFFVFSGGLLHSSCHGTGPSARENLPTPRPPLAMAPWACHGAILVGISYLSMLSPSQVRLGQALCFLPRGVISGVASNYDSLAERSKAVAQGAIPKGRGFEPHSCQFVCKRCLM